MMNVRCFLQRLMLRELLYCDIKEFESYILVLSCLIDNYVFCCIINIFLVDSIEQK